MECEDQDTQQRDPKTQMYLNVMMRFSQALLKVRTSGGASPTTVKSSCASVPFQCRHLPFPPGRQEREDHAVAVGLPADIREQTGAADESRAKRKRKSKEKGPPHNFLGTRFLFILQILA